MMVLSKATHRVAMQRANMQRERARPERCEDWAPISSAASEGVTAGPFSSTGSEDSPPERQGGSISDMFEVILAPAGSAVNIVGFKGEWTDGEW